MLRITSIKLPFRGESQPSPVDQVKPWRIWRTGSRGRCCHVDELRRLVDGSADGELGKWSMTVADSDDGE